MSDKPKKKKFLWQQYIAFAFSMLIGASCGVLMVKYLENSHSADKSSGEKILSLLILFFVMYVGLLVQTILHEAGHLLFGLLSGYQFSSFRIMSFMWIKEKGKLRFRRFSLAGTGGQCLMSPPDLIDGKLPVALYNLGGSLMNILTGLIFLCLYFLTGRTSLLSTTMLLTAIIGFLMAIINGVPMRMGTVDNDGYNALALRRDPDALRAFWIQMKVNEQLSRGLRLKDMPAEWFAVPTDEKMKNSIIAASGVFACNRLMDQQQFEKADALMEHMLTIDSGIVGIHRSLMICDRIYLELISQNRSEELSHMLTKEQKQFMKAMKTFPSVLRTQYTYALLAEKDLQKAEKILIAFEKCAKTYPYPNDIQSERELIENARKL